MYYLLFIVIVIFSCKEKENYNTISINIEKKNQISMLKIFDHIELVPLETKQESLITGILKLRVFKDKYYILDRKLPIIFIFDLSGNYISKIDKQGNDPEGYINISDFEIDSLNNKLSLLSSSNNTMLDFDLKGNFLKRYSLPKINGAYMQFNFINKDIIVYWTFDCENRIKFYSISKNKIIKESFPENRNKFNDFLLIFPSGNFFCRPTSNMV